VILRKPLIQRLHTHTLRTQMLDHIPMARRLERQNWESGCRRERLQPMIEILHSRHIALEPAL
jgi:hypothetical protein